jgi:hypothetical protein
MAGKNLPTEVRAAAEREGFSSAEYNAVAMNSSLDTIKLVNLVLETNPEVQQRDDERELSFGRKVLSCRFDKDSGAAAAIFQFCVSVLRGGDEEFKCIGDYAVLYDMPQDAKAEAATAFCKHVGSFAAYPYFRAVAAQMAWNAGVDLPPIPSIAAMPVVPKPPQEKSAKPKTAAKKLSKRKPTAAIK